MKNLLALAINIFTFVALRISVGRIFHLSDVLCICPSIFNIAKCGLSWSFLLCVSWVHNILTTLMTRILLSLSIRVQSTLNNISICFFIPQYQRQRKGFFCFHRVSEPELKKALHDTSTRAALSGLLLTMAN